MKLRLSHVLVQPVLVWDDGEEITPGPPIAPQALTLKALGSFAESLPDEIARIEAEVRPA